MAQKEQQAYASALKLTRGTRFVNVLEVGVERESNTGEPRMTGPTLALELPVFDQGQARVGKLEALLRQSQDRKAALSTEIGTEISSAWQRAETARQSVQHTHDVLMPLRRQIQNQSQLYYNGMLIGMYELLADARERINALLGFIDASREYWLAEAELQLAVGGKLPSPPAPPPLAGEGSFSLSPVSGGEVGEGEAKHQHKEHK
jgi:outer membrane protein TolC